MEMSIRQNRSAEISAAINQQFYNIIRLSEQADQITETWLSKHAIITRY